MDGIFKMPCIFSRTERYWKESPRCLPFPQMNRTRQPTPSHPTTTIRAILDGLNKKLKEKKGVFEEFYIYFSKSKFIEEKAR